MIVDRRERLLLSLNGLGCSGGSSVESVESGSSPVADVERVKPLRRLAAGVKQHTTDGPRGEFSRGRGQCADE